MGLLDDAIREHLELKRRRGADPAEVEKQEREALGPIGTVPEADQRPLAVEDAPLDDVHDDEPPAGYDDEPPAGYDDEPPAGYDDFDDGGVPLDDERAALRPDAAYDDDPDPFEDAHAPRADEPAGAVRAPGPPPPAPPAREPEPPPAVSQPTEQYSVEDLEELGREDDEPAASGEAPEGEDVLDETPEFLQEAPEHDRLWFEQRPPRDFDF